MADSSGKKTKRLVKNPETFRERALKASEAADQPKQPGRVRRFVRNLFGRIFRPVKAISKWLYRFKIIRIIGRVVVPKYIRQSWKELRLVTWPTWKQSVQLTYAVLIFAVIFGATIAAVDYGLDKIFRNILLR
ncbi:MAG TPA: preprotein translocase subunit SecE [Candidatus Saccharimonadales bacterium]|nr:preprotein translocase subunit SecE [Candidatus Saccharimonadales bacterium]